jgi:hypothetical protein
MAEVDMQCHVAGHFLVGKNCVEALPMTGVQSVTVIA